MVCASISSVRPVRFFSVAKTERMSLWVRFEPTRSTEILPFKLASTTSRLSKVSSFSFFPESNSVGADSDDNATGLTFGVDDTGSESSVDGSAIVGGVDLECFAPGWLAGLEAVDFWEISAELVDRLAASELERQRWAVTLVEDHLYVDADGVAADCEVSKVRYIEESPRR